jgi:hypothetical protein
MDTKNHSQEGDQGKFPFVFKPGKTKLRRRRLYAPSGRGAGFYVFWSKDKEEAQEFAQKVGGVTMEMTEGGQVFGDGGLLGSMFSEWNTGSMFDAKPAWDAISEKFADNAVGRVYYFNPTSVNGEFWAKEQEILLTRKTEGHVAGIDFICLQGRHKPGPYTDKKRSKGYNDLMEWMHMEEPRIKNDVTFPDLLGEIEERERKKVETILRDAFVDGGFAHFAVYMPQLKMHDGIGILKKKLTSIAPPSGASIAIAAALIDATGDEQYYGTIAEYYGANEKSGLVVATILSYRKPSDALFSLLASIYIDDGNKYARCSAARGLLRCKGYLKDVHDQDEQDEKKALLESVFSPSMGREERRALVEKLRAGIPIEDGR